MDSACHTCPLCGSVKTRHAGGDLYRCGLCGGAFNEGYRPLDYGNDYFIEEYRNQYGRTYEEDFSQIYAMAQTRLKRILSLFQSDPHKSRASLLDIGSALGFFLKAARDSGFGPVKGIEISEYASQYCRERLDIEVENSPFDQVADPGTFSVITAWYFIEHCEDTLAVLEKIYGSLEEGGVLAFSAPSVFGPLYRFSRDQWISTHPTDHRVDFSPSAARKTLRSIGFRKIRVYPGGFHPERVLDRDSFFYPVFSMLYRRFADLTAYSDTIEVYAVK